MIREVDGVNQSSLVDQNHLASDEPIVSPSALVDQQTLIVQEPPPLSPDFLQSLTIEQLHELVSAGGRTASELLMIREETTNRENEVATRLKIEKTRAFFSEGIYEEMPLRLKELHADGSLSVGFPDRSIREIREIARGGYKTVYALGDGKVLKIYEGNFSNTLREGLERKINKGITSTARLIADDLEIQERLGDLRKSLGSDEVYLTLTQPTELRRFVADIEQTGFIHTDTGYFPYAIQPMMDKKPTSLSEREKLIQQVPALLGVPSELTDLRANAEHQFLTDPKTGELKIIDLDDWKSKHELKVITNLSTLVQNQLEDMIEEPEDVLSAFGVSWITGAEREQLIRALDDKDAALLLEEDVPREFFTDWKRAVVLWNTDRKQLDAEFPKPRSALARRTIERSLDESTIHRLCIVGVKKLIRHWEIACHLWQRSNDEKIMKASVVAAVRSNQEALIAFMDYNFPIKTNPSYYREISLEKLQNLFDAVPRAYKTEARLFSKAGIDLPAVRHDAERQAQLETSLELTPNLGIPKLWSEHVKMCRDFGWTVDDTQFQCSAFSEVVVPVINNIQLATQRFGAYLNNGTSYPEIATDIWIIRMMAGCQNDYDIGSLGDLVENAPKGTFQIGRTGLNIFVKMSGEIINHKKLKKWQHFASFETRAKSYGESNGIYAAELSQQSQKLQELGFFHYNGCLFCHSSVDISRLAELSGLNLESIQVVKSSDRNKLHIRCPIIVWAFDTEGMDWGYFETSTFPPSQYFRGHFSDYQQLLSPESAPNVQESFNFFRVELNDYDLEMELLALNGTNVLSLSSSQPEVGVNSDKDFSSRRKSMVVNKLDINVNKDKLDIWMLNGQPELQLRQQIGERKRLHCQLSRDARLVIPLSWSLETVQVGNSAQSTIDLESDPNCRWTIDINLQQDTGLLSETIGAIDLSRPVQSLAPTTSISEWVQVSEMRKQRLREQENYFDRDLVPEEMHRINIRGKEYAIKSKLGEGVTGKSFLYTSQDGDHVVLKMQGLPIDASVSDRLQKEIYRLIEYPSKLTHSLTVKLLDTGRTALGQTYLVEDLAPGLQLTDRSILNDKNVPLSVALHIASELARFVTALHEQNISLTDNKVDNVFWDPETNRVTYIDIDLMNTLTPDNRKKLVDSDLKFIWNALRILVLKSKKESSAHISHFSVQPALPSDLKDLLVRAESGGFTSMQECAQAIDAVRMAHPDLATGPAEIEWPEIRKEGRPVRLSMTPAKSKLISEIDSLDSQIESVTDDAVKGQLTQKRDVLQKSLDAIDQACVLLGHHFLTLRDLPTEAIDQLSLMVAQDNLKGDEPQTQLDAVKLQKYLAQVRVERVDNNIAEKTSPQTTDARINFEDATLPPETLPPLDLDQTLGDVLGNPDLFLSLATRAPDWLAGHIADLEDMDEVEQLLALTLWDEGFRDRLKAAFPNTSDPLHQGGLNLLYQIKNRLKELATDPDDWEEAEAMLEEIEGEWG